MLGVNLMQDCNVLPQYVVAPGTYRTEVITSEVVSSVHGYAFLDHSQESGFRFYERGDRMWRNWSLNKTSKQELARVAKTMLTK